jgi:DNA-binding PucR family transcriptional regulator
MAAIRQAEAEVQFKEFKLMSNRDMLRRAREAELMAAQRAEQGNEDEAKRLMKIAITLRAKVFGRGDPDRLRTLAERMLGEDEPPKED